MEGQGAISLDPYYDRGIRTQEEASAMLRMEIALFIIVGFVACVYFSAEKERSPLHGTF